MEIRFLNNSGLAAWLSCFSITIAPYNNNSQLASIVATPSAEKLFYMKNYGYVTSSKYKQEFISLRTPMLTLRNGAACRLEWQ